MNSVLLPLLRAALVALLATAMLLTAAAAPPAHAWSDGEPAPRVWGADRFETAANLALQQFPDGTSVVVLARGDDHVDAVTAAPLARHLGGPVLLVTRDSVPEATATAIFRLSPDEIVVVGGPAVVSDTTMDEAARGTTARRVFGANRYATAAAVAEEVGLANGVWVASTWQDSLIAASTGPRPVLQTGATLPEETEAILRRVDRQVDVLAPDVAEAVRRVAPVPVVLHDPQDPTDRSTTLAGAPSPAVTITTALNWPDALAAAAWRPDGPLLLIDPDARVTDQPMGTWLTTHLLERENLLIVGGPNAVGHQREAEIRDLLLQAQHDRRAEWVEANQWRRAPVDIPSHAVRITPSDDAAAIVASHVAGTTFAFTAGVHRGVEITVRRGDTFLGEAGAILDGSTVLPAAGFQHDGATGLWSHAAPASTVRHKPEDCEAGSSHHYEADRGVLCLPEDLFVDGEFMRREASRGSVDAPGEWALDAGRIWVHDDPGTTGEFHVSTAMNAFRTDHRSDVADVHIEGLEIRHYAPRPQEGAIQGTWGVNWTVRNVHAHHNHAHGVQLSAGGVLADSLLADNGQMGFGARGVTAGAAAGPTAVTGNEIARNNLLGYRSAWEAGAMKVLGSTQVRMSGNWVHDNNGHGIWFDTDNRDVQIIGNVVEDNTGTGIVYEISHGPTLIADNLVLRHGDKAVWVSDSSGTTVQNNVLADAANGVLHVTDDGRYEGTYRGVDVTVMGNDMTHRLGRWQSGWRRAPHVSGSLDPADTGVRFTGNTWRTDTPDRYAMAYYGTAGAEQHRTWEQWKGLGMDVDGIRLPLHTRPETLPDGQPLPLGR